MNIQQLRTFRVVAELGSLSRASDRLHIVQPALSRQIKQLEFELQTPLFERTRQGMVLTEMGKLLLVRATSLIQQIEQMRDELLSAAGSPVGHVTLGLVPSVSHVLTARLAKNMSDALPGVTLRILERTSVSIIDGLQSGEMDMAILHRTKDRLLFRTEILARDDFRIIGLPGSFEGKPKSRSLTWLAKRPLVLSSLLKGYLEVECAKRKLPLNVRIEVDSARTLIEMVSLGLGYTLLPPSAAASEIRTGIIESVALSDPTIARVLMLAFRNAKFPTAAAQAVHALIRAEVSSVAAEGSWTAHK